MLTIGNIADMTLWWSTLWSGRWEVFDMVPPGHTKQTYRHLSDHTQTDRLAVNTCGSGESCGLISHTKHLRRCCRLAVANCTTHVMSPMPLVLTSSYHRARKPAGWRSVYRDWEFRDSHFPTGIPWKWEWKMLQRNMMKCVSKLVRARSLLQLQAIDFWGTDLELWTLRIRNKHWLKLT